jgi:hypothetical protein
VEEADFGRRITPLGIQRTLQGQRKEAAMNKKLLAAVVAGAMLLVAPVLPAGAKKKKAKPKPVVVMTDAAGDAGNQDTGAPGAAEAGFDMVKGIIGQKGKNVTFSVEHSQMPESGSLGEGFRLIWGLVVDGEVYEMTVKSLDVGKPDVIASAMGQSPNGAERVGQVYQGVARLEQCGTLSAGISWSQCTAVAYYDATFDAAKKTASWAIDMKTLKAKKGSLITGGGNRADTGCLICWVPQYAERSLTPQSIIDSAAPTKNYKIK